MNIDANHHSSASTTTSRGTLTNSQPASLHIPTSDNSILGIPKLLLEETLSKQKECIETSQATRDLLEHSENVSAFAYEYYHQRYAQHIQTLRKTRTELQQIFTRIRYNI